MWPLANSLDLHDEIDTLGVSPRSSIDSKINTTDLDFDLIQTLLSAVGERWAKVYGGGGDADMTQLVSLARSSRHWPIPRAAH